MQELSMNILDIAQNGIRAGATLIDIAINKDLASEIMTISIKDNGCGMSKTQVENVTNPFFTTRTTRAVGLGVPFFKMSAELTGGSFKIDSVQDKGTQVLATYNLNHIDLMPIGDMAATMVTLIGMNTEMDFTYTYTVNNESFCLDTREIKEILAGVPLNSHEVLSFVTEFIEDNTAELAMFQS